MKDPDQDPFTLTTVVLNQKLNFIFSKLSISLAILQNFCNGLYELCINKNVDPDPMKNPNTLFYPDICLNYLALQYM